MYHFKGFRIGGATVLSGVYLGFPIVCLVLTPLLGTKQGLCDHRLALYTQRDRRVGGKGRRKGSDGGLSMATRMELLTIPL